jgi:uncharacterized protein YndB with AHSA1/START domain
MEKEKSEIKHTWNFRQSPAEVWEYLTKPELLEQWLAKMDFKPVVGHQFEVPNKSGRLTKCEVAEVTPFTRLSYSWKFPSMKSERTFDSKVVWTLTKTKEGTQLQLVHDGFSILEDYIAHDNGWTTLGNRLTKLLNASS